MTKIKYIIYNVFMTIKIKSCISFAAVLVAFISVVPAQAGCTKTIQHRNYDARGKLTGFTYERVYSSDCSFYGSTKPTRSLGRRK